MAVEIPMAAEVERQRASGERYGQVGSLLRGAAVFGLAAEANSRTGSEMMTRRTSKRKRSRGMPVLLGCMAVLLWAMPGAAGQSAQGNPAKHPDVIHVHASTRGDARKAAPATQELPTPTPEPPQVTLQNGRLTVRAQNSDLGTILGDIARLSGMRIQGADTRAHVFGVYGPGDVRQVLTELLDGLGDNFMLVGGTQDGTPQELLLTARGAAPPAPATQEAKPAQENSDDDADQQQPLGPGAILHVPPSVKQQNDPSLTQQRVQQNLQRLQQIRQQMQQQREQNQPQ